MFNSLSALVLVVSKQLAIQVKSCDDDFFFLVIHRQKAGKGVEPTANTLDEAFTENSRKYS